MATAEGATPALRLGRVFSCCSPPGQRESLMEKMRLERQGETGRARSQQLKQRAGGRWLAAGRRDPQLASAPPKIPALRLNASDLRPIVARSGTVHSTFSGISESMAKPASVFSAPTGPAGHAPAHLASHAPVNIQAGGRGQALDGQVSQSILRPGTPSCSSSQDHYSLHFSTTLLFFCPLAHQVDPVTLTRHPHLTAARPTPSPAPSIPVPLVLTPPWRPTISPPSTIRVFSCSTACARTPAERRPQILLVDTCSLVVRFTVYLSLFNLTATRCSRASAEHHRPKPLSISGYRQRLARSTLNLIIP